MVENPPPRCHSQQLRLLSACLFVAVFAVLGTGCGDKPSPGTGLTEVKFMADWMAVPEQGGFFQAKASGLYEDAGLDVTIRHRTGKTPQTMYLGQGQVDLSIGGSDEAFLAIGRGMDIVILAAYFENHPYCLMFHKGHGVDSFDAIGDRGIMAFVGATWIPYVENKYSVDLNIQTMDESITQFLNDGKKQLAQAVFVTNEPIVAHNAGFETEVLMVAESGWNPYKVIMGNRRFVEQHPETVRAFLEATFAGWRAYMDPANVPDAADAMIAERNPEMETPFLADVRAAMLEHAVYIDDPEGGLPLGTLDMDRLRAEYQALVDLGLVAVKTFPEKRVVRDFVNVVGD